MEVPLDLRRRRWPRSPGLLGATEEITENAIERRGMFDHQPVCSPRQDGEFCSRNEIGELLAVTAGRQDVLIADDDGSRNIDGAELIAQRVISGKDRLHLCGEPMRRT